MKTYRCAVVGAGVEGALRARALLATGRCQLAGVYDADGAAAQSLAARLGGQTWAREELDAASVDLVCMTAPVSAAPEGAGAVFWGWGAFGALQDAPPGRRADRAGRQTFFTASYRALPAFRTMQQAASAGEIGRPGMFRMRLCEPRPCSEAFLAQPTCTMLATLAPSVLDYVAWLLGPVERVFAQRSETLPDVVLVTVRCEGGRLAHLEFNWAQPAASSPYTALELAGSGGVLTHDSRQDVAVRAAGLWTGVGGHGCQAHWPGHQADAVQHEMEDLVRALDGDTASLLPNPEEVSRSLRAAEALHRSVEDGAPVSLA